MENHKNLQFWISKKVFLYFFQLYTITADYKSDNQDMTAVQTFSFISNGFTNVLNYLVRNYNYIDTQLLASPLGTPVLFKLLFNATIELGNYIVVTHCI